MKKIKRILALLVVVFLISLYVATLIVSFFNSPQQGNMLKACIYSTVVIPIFLWTYALIYRVLKNKKQQETLDKTEEQDTLETTNDSIQYQTKENTK